MTCAEIARRIEERLSPPTDPATENRRNKLVAEIATILQQRVTDENMDQMIEDLLDHLACYAK